MEGCRYDFILDDGVRLHRVQCKYAGVERNGIVRISLEKFSGGIKSAATARTYSAAEIDAVMVYVSNLEKILWLPPGIWEGKHAVQLRIKPATNNQRKGILPIEDFIW
jgi:diacylglycerol kinase family enzyme